MTLFESEEQMEQKYLEEEVKAKGTQEEEAESHLRILPSATPV